MEWAFGVLVALMFGLYLWSIRTANQEVSKRIQPHIEDLFGTSPRQPEKRDDTHKNSN